MRRERAWATTSPKSSCSIRATDAAKARAELDWHPTHPGLVDEFRNGSYRNGGGNR